MNYKMKLTYSKQLNMDLVLLDTLDYQWVLLRLLLCLLVRGPALID